MRGRLAVLIAAALLTVPPVNSPGVSEAAKRCTVANLNGTYVFTATGFGTPPGGIQSHSAQGHHRSHQFQR